MAEPISSPCSNGMTVDHGTTRAFGCQQKLRLREGRGGRRQLSGVLVCKVRPTWASRRPAVVARSMVNK
jgi:hypothetical protein